DRVRGYASTAIIRGNPRLRPLQNPWGGLRKEGERVEESFLFHHIGLAVHDVEAATRALAPLGLARDPELADCDDEALSVRLRFLRAPHDHPLVELVQGLPTGTSPVAAILEKNGPIPYHISYQVPSLEWAASILQAKGFRAVTPRLMAKA